MATILIVDDVPTNRTFLMTLLRQQGHRLVEAEDGLEGMVVIRAEHPDLVITDIQMPVMDGYEFVRALRLDPSTRRLPVVFYTSAFDERDATALAISSDVSDVLMKSASAEDVLEVVGRALSRSLPTNSGR
jgi:two-component system cell cycle sensor histidine kinase/response regulator CckA